MLFWVTLNQALLLLTWAEPVGSLLNWTHFYFLYPCFYFSFAFTSSFSSLKLRQEKCGWGFFYRIIFLCSQSRETNGETHKLSQTQSDGDGARSLGSSGATPFRRWWTSRCWLLGAGRLTVIRQPVSSSSYFGGSEITWLPTGSWAAVRTPVCLE